jgi:hypothetical protein
VVQTANRVICLIRTCVHGSIDEWASREGTLARQTPCSLHPIMQRPAMRYLCRSRYSATACNMIRYLTVIAEPSHWVFSITVHPRSLELHRD